LNIGKTSSSGYSQFPIPPCYIFIFHFLTLCTSVPSYTWSCFFPPPPLCFTSLSLPLYPVIILFSFLCRNKKSTLWSSFFLSCICLVGCVVSTVSFRANHHLSGSAYHVCSFVTGLSHWGWYFLVLSICLQISWHHCFQCCWAELHCVNYQIFCIHRGIWVISSSWLL